jgi:hypothetical protein
MLWFLTTCASRRGNRICSGAEPMLFDAAIFDAWEADPDHAELMAIDEECTRLGDAAADLRYDIVDTPATSAPPRHPQRRTQTPSCYGLAPSSGGCNSNTSSCTPTMKTMTATFPTR